MFLKRLTLQNFRSHAETTIDFDEVTWLEPASKIRVPNDLGKTNILRALKIVLFHEDFPETMLRFGTKEGFIEAECSNGSLVRREWKGGKQYTTYMDSAGHGTTLEGANGAAAIVKDILGVSKIILDKDPEDFNFIKAGAEPFLLNDRSDTVLKKLSFLIGSQKIEDAALAIASELRKTDTEKELVRKDVEKQKQLLEVRAPIVEEIKFLLESYKTVKQTLDMLGVSLTQIQKFKIFKERYNSTLQLSEDLKEQKTFVEELRNLQERYSKLQSLAEKQKDLQESIESLQFNILLAKARLDELEEEQKKNPICPTCNRPL